MNLVISNSIKIDNTYTISSDSRSNIHTPVFKNMEECENWFVSNDIDIHFKDQTLNIIVSGGDSLCGSILFLSEKLTRQNNKINIIYFIQDHTELSVNEKTNNKIAINVFQEYARSGMIDCIYLIDINTIHKIYENIPILKYKTYRNLVVSDICNFIDWTHTQQEPIFGKITEFNQINRIRTVSYVFLNNSICIDFCELDESVSSEKKFYFLMSESELDSNQDALTIMKSMVGMSGPNSSFAVFNIGSSVKANHYCIKSTNVVKQFQ